MIAAAMMLRGTWKACLQKPAIFLRHASTGGVWCAYQRLVEEGHLLPDSSQAAAAQALQLLQESFLATVAAAAGGGAVTSVSAQHNDPHTDRSSAAQTMQQLQGAYLWGAVGSGKTMLADLFCSTLPTSVAAAPLADARDQQQQEMDQQQQQQQQQQEQQHRVPLLVRRAHFHEFMQQVHQRQHELQQALPRLVVKSRSGLPVYRYATPSQDPLLTIADEVAAQQQLLYLDELHITDVADAMVLGRLFGGLMVRGCWLVFTSNRPARALYQGGLNRRFLDPFIHLLHEHLLHLKVASGVDYRRRAPLSSSSSSRQHEQNGQGSMDQQGALPGWLCGSGAADQLEVQWQQHLGRCNSKAGPVQLQLPYGRTLTAPVAVEPLSGTHAGAAQQQGRWPAAADSSDSTNARSAAAWFSFDQLCGRVGCSTNPAAPAPLAAPEFLAIAQRFARVYISGIPQLQVAQRDEARRLVTLIDILYDARCQLVASAAVPVEELFLPLLAAAYAQGVNPSLGTAQPIPLDKVRQQLHPAGPITADLSRSGPRGLSTVLQDLPHSLYAEEVLMYHRATSRLIELTSSA